MESKINRGSSKVLWAVTLLLLCPFLYVLSSGPVLATAFWLREATGWNGWYSAMLLYYPLLMLGHGNWVDMYIEFWVKLFGTVGPG
jgi:hypothetical protein